MTAPAKKSRGRPKRTRILAETAFRMRRDGVPLREIQSLLNAQGMMQLEDCGLEVKPYFRAARRWADSGEATLKQFKASEGRELQDLALRRYLEAMELLEKIAAGQVPLFGADGRVIPMKGETEQEAARRVSIGRAALAMGGRRPREARDTKSVSAPRPALPPNPRRAPPRPRPPLREARRRPGRPRLERQVGPAAVAVVRPNDRDLDSALQSQLRDEARRLLTTTKASLSRDSIATELHLQPSREDGVALAKALHRLTDEGVIVREGFLYHVAP